MTQPIMKGLVIAGVVGLAITACSSSPSSKSTTVAQGKPLVVVDNTGETFTRAFNPYVSTSLGNSNNSTALVYEPLLLFNIMQPTQPPTPWLATHYAWSNGGKTLTLTIRSGVKFSDGKPLTAADVAFSFNLLKNNPHPTEPEIRKALEGNICRCTGYQNIVRAVQYAAEQMRTAAAAPVGGGE